MSHKPVTWDHGSRGTWSFVPGSVVGPGIGFAYEEACVIIFGLWTLFEWPTYMVQMSGLKDENKILRFPAKSRTFFRMASKNKLISKGAWHSLVPSLSFMSHLTSMLNPHVSSIFVNASSRVGKGS